MIKRLSLSALNRFFLRRLRQSIRELDSKMLLLLFASRIASWEILYEIMRSGIAVMRGVELFELGFVLFVWVEGHVRAFDVDDVFVLKDGGLEFFEDEVFGDFPFAL